MGFCSWVRSRKPHIDRRRGHLRVGTSTAPDARDYVESKCTRARKQQRELLLQRERRRQIVT